MILIEFGVVVIVAAAAASVAVYKRWKNGCRSEIGLSRRQASRKKYDIINIYANVTLAFTFIQLFAACLL